MSFNHTSYNRVWMRNFRKRKRAEKLIASGKCPISEILLTSKYHPIDCPCGIHQ